MPKLLFKEQADWTNPSDVDAIVRKANSEEKKLLEQSHQYVEGSLEERIFQVRAEFREWCKAKEGTDYSWWYTQIIAVLDDSIVYCTQKNWDGEYSYVQLPYTASNGKVAFGEGTPIDVKVVIATLSAEEEAEDQARSNEMSETKKKTQDKVGDETKLLKDAADGEVNHSDSDPVVPSTETDANKGGSTVPDTEKEAASDTPVEHAGDEGVSKGKETGEADKVKDELNKTAAGLKQELQSASKDSSNRSLAYIDLTQSKEVKDTEGNVKTLRLTGIATRADIVNSQGQVYPLEVWEENVPKMNDLCQAGKFLGKVEHPEQEQGLVDVAIKYNKFWLQGSDVWFEADVVPTEPYGKNLMAIIQAGVQVDLSTRGYGVAKTQSWRGQEAKVIQKGFVCTAVDAVWFGSSAGSTVTDVEPVYQSKTEPEEGITTMTEAEKQAQAVRDSQNFADTKRALLAQSKLSEVGQKAYETALGKAKDINELMTTHNLVLPTLQSTFPNAELVEELRQSTATTQTPSIEVKQTKSEAAPQSVSEMLDRLVADLPDDKNGGFSQRQSCRKLLGNIAAKAQDTFNGPAAARALLALEQGRVDMADNILKQSIATGGTVADGNADGGGAPLSAPMIFPLVRRVFPMYIMNEIASIQPLDRPEGKIFYLDTYRTEDPAGYEKRIDLNTSSNPFNSSYADNAVEGAAAKLMRLRLSSVLVDAKTKKLGAAWSIEEMQDLRAYHNLDASQELMGSVAREMALEWNKEVLDDMILQATASSLTFGTGAPVTGFAAQTDWDEYIWNYIQKLDNDIFSKRNGPMTHLVCGIDAALAMSKSLRGALTIGGQNGGEMDMYPGTTFFGSVNIPGVGNYKIFKTNFWGAGTTNGSKILGLRRGTEWSDTPYIYAPYTEYVTPILTDPADFSQKQGIVSRAAKKVVVPDAMGTITVSSGTGAVI